MKAVLAALTCVLIFTPAARAEETRVPTSWGVEIDAIRPLLYSQIQLRATRTLTRSGDLVGELVFGANGLPGRTNRDGKQQELQAIVGWRQFFWKGAHVELTLLPGYAHQESAIDGKTRNSFVLSTELVAGYRYDIELLGLNWYLLGQVGGGIVFYNSDPWPVDEGVKYQRPYFAGSVALGLRF